MTVSQILELLEKRNAKDDDFLFTRRADPYFHDYEECAVVALEKTIGFINGETENLHKFVLLIEAFYGADYFKCLTIGEFRKFLRNLKNKNQLIICICSEKRLSNYPVKDAYSRDGFGDINQKMRDIVGGDNIFYLVT